VSSLWQRILIEGSSFCVYAGTFAASLACAIRRDDVRVWFVADSPIDPALGKALYPTVRQALEPFRDSYRGGLGVATMPAQERVAITLRSTAQVLVEEIGDLSERLLGLGYAVIYLVLGV
jgi:hypothetical protein